MKPNPSLSGKSKFPHSPLWLNSEQQILEWWIRSRQTAVTITEAALAPNLNDSILLHAEKEALEWWHNMREIL